MGSKTILLGGFLFIFIAGVTCLVWPGKMQEYALKWSVQGLGQYNPFSDWMKTRGYIVCLRFMGLFLVGVASLVFFLVFKGVHK